MCPMRLLPRDLPLRRSGAGPRAARPATHQQVPPSGDDPATSPPTPTPTCSRRSRSPSTPRLASTASPGKTTRQPCRHAPHTDVGALHHQRWPAPPRRHGARAARKAGPGRRDDRRRLLPGSGPRALPADVCRPQPLRHPSLEVPQHPLRPTATIRHNSPRLSSPGRLRSGTSSSSRKQASPPGRAASSP